MAGRKKASAPAPAPDALNEVEIGNLQFIVEQHNGGSVTYANDEYFGELANKGYIEVNKELTTANGDYAARPTEKGIKFMADQVQTEASGNSPEAKVAFAVEDNIAIPTSKRGAGGGVRGPRGSIYPFDTMENGQSFFVPATEERPNPAKTLASTAAVMAKRYATEAGTRTIKYKGQDKQVPAFNYTRKFVVRAVEENGVKGARVWRHDGAADPAPSQNG